MLIVKNLYFICFVISSFVVAQANPKCDISGNPPTILTCTPTDTDYILKRGMVSNNIKITSITLRGCRISEVQLGAFENLNALEYLDLSRNNIIELTLGALDGITSLKHLNLSYNLITELSADLFNRVPNLNELDLKENSLNNINPFTFKPLLKLQWLDISSNGFPGKNIYLYIFDNSRKIKFINFAHNDMNDAPTTLFNPIEALETLHLENCFLYEVPLFATRRNTLKYLMLSSNQIQKLENAKIFTNLSNLNTLNLADNDIESIDSDVFKPLKKLKIIVLRGNKITNLPDTLFKDMKSLGNIDLSHNQISNVPVDAFRGTSLKNFNIANNRITYLVDNFCLELRNSGARLTKFYFNQNPWQCACLRAVLNEVKNHKIAYNNVSYDGKTPVCVSTEELFCKRHDVFNIIYMEMYDSLILEKERDK